MRGDVVAAKTASASGQPRSAVRRQLGAMMPLPLQWAAMIDAAPETHDMR